MLQHWLQDGWMACGVYSNEANAEVPACGMCCDEANFETDVEE